VPAAVVYFHLCKHPMNFSSLLVFAADPPAADGSPPMIATLIPILVMVVIGYFLLLRPMRAQEHQRKTMAANLKKNDKIVNSGGIIGVVDSIKDKEDEVVLRGGLRITRSSIVRILTGDEGSKDQKEGS